MNRIDEHQGMDAREEGRHAWLDIRRNRNPYPAGSFNAYCWAAGYSQDVRSIDELDRDWSAARVRT